MPVIVLTDGGPPGRATAATLVENARAREQPLVVFL